MPGKKKNLTGDSKVDLEIMKCDYKQRALDKLFLELEYTKLKLDVQDAPDEQDDETIKYLKQLNMDIKKKQKQKPGCDFYFVTVSPTIGTDFHLLQTKVQKYTTRMMIRSAMYTYELTKQNNPHVHILVENAGYTDKDFRRNTCNTFKKIVGDIRCINIKSVPEDWVQDKIEYIKGEKWDSTKDDMIENDKKWRLEMSLQPYYIIGTKFE